jgi:hypothetical protein
MNEVENDRTINCIIFEIEQIKLMVKELEEKFERNKKNE